MAETAQCGAVSSRDEDLTRNETLVLNALRASKQPLGAYDLLRCLKADGVKNPATVYRALDTLMNRKVAHRIESANAFIACSNSCGSGRAAFMICETCGKAEEFCDERLDELITASSRRTGFTVRNATMEFRGLCGACASCASTT